MTKPFTCISSIRQATGSIYPPFALARGSRATRKGSDGDFGKKALSPHAERGLDPPGLRTAMALAENLFQERERGVSCSGRPTEVGVRPPAPRLGRKQTDCPPEQPELRPFPGGARPGHP